jgi:hypothetical protein
MTTTAPLTPTTNTAPATVNVTPELSGPVWCDRFPGSRQTLTLNPDFRDKCDAFIAAIEAAGGVTDIQSTYRPRERAYLMHWSHKIVKNGFDPAEVPAMAGVNIKWNHSTMQASVDAAHLMSTGFGINGLAANTAPSLNTLHMSREAIDIKIWWTGTLNIANKDGTITTINTTPRTGMNLQLKEVGLTYGVKKFIGGNADKPHWSTTGH